MSTNAVIRIEGVGFAEVYKHWDGYPDATLPFLKMFNKDFAENRGSDPEYKFAQLLRETIRSGEEFNLDMSNHTGWGVCEYDSMGYDYLYTLKDDGSVTVE